MFANSIMQFSPISILTKVTDVKDVRRDVPSPVHDNSLLLIFTQFIATSVELIKPIDEPASHWMAIEGFVLVQESRDASELYSCPHDDSYWTLYLVEVVKTCGAGVGAVSMATKLLTHVSIKFRACV